MDPIEKLQTLAKILANPFSDIPQLTDREKEAAKLAAFGFKLRQIGEVMGISVSTAGDYLSKIKKKIGLNKSELTQALIAKFVEVLQSPPDERE